MFHGNKPKFHIKSDFTPNLIKILDFAMRLAHRRPKAGEVVTLVYKIIDRAAWAEAEAAGVFAGAPVDLADGFIHFSAAAQVAETAAKHFAGQADLLLVAVETALLGDALKWEVSRGGALFPHLYAPLDPRAAAWVRPLPLGQDGRHDFTGLLS